MNDIIQEKLKLLPSTPGVYKMYDANGTLIYVGKAISLKNRVRQYFHASKNHTPKVLAMVSHIADFETISVTNETEALSLESNLIHQYKPKYNILLKDDKHFPYVRIDIRQDFPRIEIVRRVQKDGALYLGPYLSAVALRDAMNVVREQFPVRYCRKDLDRAIARRERPCLMYHVGKCCGPCTGNVTRQAYHDILDTAASFLKGNTDAVIASLTEKMQAAAMAEEFEKAAKYRDTIRVIGRISDKQAVISTSSNALDVFAVARYHGDTCVFGMFVRNGKVIGTEKYRMDADEETMLGEVLGAFLTQFYLDSNAFPPEILVNLLPPDADEIMAWLHVQAGHICDVRVPQRGNKRKLVELAGKNCLEAMEKDEIIRNHAYERGEGALAELSIILGLDSVPQRMECYDNSHFMGRDTVGSMVVFTDGQPDKKAYRRFKIRTDAGGDDLVAMQEMLTRRFTRYLDGDAGFSPLPDLLVIDGGVTQLAVAMQVLDELGLSHIPVIGLAESHELIYMPGNETPIALERNSAPLHLLERIRDEAHRFAITYHRSLRQKNALYSILDQIEGIGEKRKRALFDAFTTLDAIKEADMEKLRQVPGMNLTAAESVYQYFHGDGA